MGEKQHLTDREKRIYAGAGLVLFGVLMVVACVCAGRPLIRFMGEPELFRGWVDEKGLPAHILFVGMVVLQVIVAIIPGEPLEIAAGYAFGAVEGTLLCVAGTTLGGALVFQLVRRFGTKAIEVFFPLENLRSLRFLEKSEKRLHLLVFFLFFLPGTPKDLLCYFVGLTKLPLKNWLIITAVARLPSIITSTVGGNALGTERYLFALAVFGATLLISAAGVWIYQKISAKDESGHQN